jgi:hypothetical protein
MKSYPAAICRQLASLSPDVNKMAMYFLVMPRRRNRRERAHRGTAILPERAFDSPALPAEGPYTKWRL